MLDKKIIMKKANKELNWLCLAIIPAYWRIFCKLLYLIAFSVQKDTL